MKEDHILPPFPQTRRGQRMARQQQGWSWSSALVGAASAAAATAVVLGLPRDPTFHLISITLSSFRLNVPLLDVEVTLTVHVTNPNLVPINYAPATITIFYAGSHLGSAALDAGCQPPHSCQLLHLPARLYGLELAQHIPSLLADAARREMALDASVDISGTAQVLWWAHRFSIHVESHVLVDPIFLEVIDQENHSETHLHLS